MSKRKKSPVSGYELKRREKQSKRERLQHMTPEERSAHNFERNVRHLALLRRLGLLNTNEKLWTKLYTVDGYSL